MGSLKRIGVPILKDFGKSLLKVGMKRAATLGGALYTAWEDMIDDDQVTRSELDTFARVGRVALGDATQKITKAEASQMSYTVLTKGLGLPMSDAQMLIATIHKARKKGVDPLREMGIKDTDEQQDQEDTAVLDEG